MSASSLCIAHYVLCAVCVCQLTAHSTGPCRDKASRGPESSKSHRKQGHTPPLSKTADDSSSQKPEPGSKSSRPDPGSGSTKPDNGSSTSRPDSGSRSSLMNMSVNSGGISFATKQTLPAASGDGSSAVVTGSLLSQSLLCSTPPLPALVEGEDGEDSKGIRKGKGKSSTMSLFNTDSASNSKDATAAATATGPAGSGVDGSSQDSFSPIDLSRSMAHTHRERGRGGTLSESRADGMAPEGREQEQEALTEQAVTVVQRVLDKLTGLDFQERGRRAGRREALDIPQQVDLLIEQATSNDNLSTCFIGWCAFW